MKNITPEIVYEMFPDTPTQNIDENLPYVLGALENFGLMDKDMILVALSTIRAETESFEPISEYISRYNTSGKSHPFDLYDDREDLGNEGAPDGSLYRGRGYVQLTGKYNYKNYGTALGVDLVNEPELANDPEIAADILCAFLKDREQMIRDALADGNLLKVRKFVNGGSYGYEKFEESFDIGQELLEESDNAD
jgi:predicted chitinase